MSLSILSEMVLNGTAKLALAPLFRIAVDWNGL
jgi:hypothetical protein